MTTQSDPGSNADRFLEANERYARSFHGPLPMPPSKHVAVVACMDARLDVYRLLGLAEGEAHVIRNAGGVVSDDVLRSLAISQRLLGTTEIVLVHHTDCGMLTFQDAELGEQIAKEVGFRPTYGFAAFANADEDVRRGLRRIAADPFLTHHDRVRGFVFDVATGRLHECDPTA